MQTRTCDSCYNRVLYLQEQANQRKFLSGIKPLHPSSNTSTPLVQSQSQSQQQQPESNENTSKRDLFGTSQSASTAAAGDSRAKRLEASSSVRGGKQQQGSASVGGMGATMNTLSETHERLQERGEKLSRLSDRTEEMSNQASEFARLAKQLKEQQQNRWF